MKDSVEFSTAQVVCGICGGCYMGTGLCARTACLFFSFLNILQMHSHWTRMQGRSFPYRTASRAGRIWSCHLPPADPYQPRHARRTKQSALSGTSMQRTFNEGSKLHDGVFESHSIPPPRVSKTATQIEVLEHWAHARVPVCATLRGKRHLSKPREMEVGGAKMWEGKQGKVPRPLVRYTGATGRIGWRWRRL